MREINNTTEDSRAKNTSHKHASLMKRATSLVQRGMYDEAIERIKEAMALKPHDPRCSIELANVYKAQNRMGLAIEAMKKAVELDPRNSAVQEQLLRVLLETERYDDAIYTSKKLLKQSPNNIFVRDILGIAYLQQGQINKALKVTNELISLDPTDCTHHFKKAVLLQQKGEIAQAMTAFTRALEMSPEGEIADDAREAIAALDAYQLRQVITLAVEDSIFRTKLILDPESAVMERGFKLSNAGILNIRQIDVENLPRESQSRFYH